MTASADRHQRATRRGLAVLLAFGASVGIVSCASHSRPVTSASAVSQVPLDPVSDSGRELTADQQVLQVLNRLTFGPRPGDVARVRELGVDRWVAQQLSPDAVRDDGDAELIARFPSYTESIDALERDYPRGQRILAKRQGVGPAGQGARPMTPEDSIAVQTAERTAGKLTADVRALKVARALMSPRQLQEVMVDFWENHFSVYDRKGQPMRYYLAAYDRDAIRPYALGRFRDLLGAVARSPAMLFYLDNWESVADSEQPTLAPRRVPRPVVVRPNRGFFAPQLPPPRPVPPPGARARPRRGLNENYGRELLELHTLGVDGGYTQEDVINVARAFTGWSIDRPNGEHQADGGFVFRPETHDAGVKIVLGHPLAEGRGLEDGDEVLSIVASHPSTARFIATKLCRRFVSDSPPPALVQRAAATFTRTDGDIRQVLWTILSSPEFFARDAYRTKVKAPFELVVGALRAVDATPDTTQRTAQMIARIGEPLYGHQAPNGYPETGESWMNTGAILNRINFGLAVAANRIPGAPLEGWPDAARLMTAPRTAQVDVVVADILGGVASPDTRAILLSGDHPLLSVLTHSAPAAPTDETANGDRDGMARRPVATAPEPKLPAVQGLAQVVGLALGAPEFQRR